MADRPIFDPSRLSGKARPAFDPSRLSGAQDFAARAAALDPIDLSIARAKQDDFGRWLREQAQRPRAGETPEQRQTRLHGGIPKPDVGTVEGVARSALDGAMLGFADEIGSYGAATLESALGLRPGMSKDEVYDAYLKMNRARGKAYAEENPITSTAAGIAGGAAPFVLSGGASAAPSLAKTAATGAAAGAAYGFGSGEGVADRAIGAAQGGVLGAVAAPALAGLGRGVERLYRRIVGRPDLFANGKLTDAGREALAKAGVAPDDISDDLARAFQERARQSIEPTASARSAMADEFGIPLTRGQSTGDVGQIAYEEAARNFGRGAGAGKTMQAFDTAQREASAQARSQISGRLSGGEPVDPMDAAAIAREGVRAAEARTGAAARAAYEGVQPGGAVIRQEAYPSLLPRVQAALETETLVPGPQARGAVQQVQNLIQATQRGPVGADDAAVVGVDFSAVERLRQRMLRVGRGLSSSDPQQAREVRAVVGALDEWTSEAFEKALIQGDDAALSQVKDARQMWRTYKETFSKQGAKDDAGGVIERIVQTDMTPNEVAGLLYGAQKVGTRGVSTRLAKRMRDILGSDSPEWGAIRSGAFEQVFQRAGGAEMGPQAASTRLTDFVKSPLAQELYSEAERATMNRYAAALKLMVPPPSATNPSKTAYATSRLVSDTWKNMVGALGFAGGDVSGGLGARVAAEVPGAVRSSIGAARAVAGAPVSTPVSARAASGAGAVAPLNVFEQLPE